MTTQTHISPTLHIYLFAERFSGPVKGLVALAGGAVAPRSGQKVNLQTLATTLYLSAVMELIDSGAASLETFEVKKLLGKEKALALSLTGSPSGPLSSLAGMVIKSIEKAKKPEDRRVREVVIRVVGGKQSTRYPWLVAFLPVVREAEELGYVQRPEKKPGLMKSMFNPLEAASDVQANSAQVDGLEPGVDAIQQRLARFEQTLGGNAALLRKEIENGVNSCMDNSD